MSKPINPVAVGGFTVGAIGLLVVGLLLFGGQQFFSADKIRYVIFFDSSLNGLDVGAPVKMQGVKIGSVAEIALLVDPANGKVIKPVVVEINGKSFVGPDGQTFEGPADREELEQNRDKLVAKGFRARLETQSLLTGLLYVDLNMYPDKPAQFTHVAYHDLVELPCVPTTVDEIRDTAEEWVKKLRGLPLDQMAKDFAVTLADVRHLVGSEEVKRSSVALAKALEGMDTTLDALNSNLGPLLQQTHRTVGETNELMRDSRAMVKDSQAMVQDVHQGIKPILAATEKTLASATAALDRAHAAAATVEGAIGPDSAMNETLLALRDAARSLKDLSDYLERHPESLISGKNH